MSLPLQRFPPLELAASPRDGHALEHTS